MYTSTRYEYAWTNDERLTLANVRAAAEHGATVLNYAELVSVNPLEVQANGRTVAVQARRVVNAAGPWVDRIRRLEDEHAKPSTRLSKGAAVLVDGGQDWGAGRTDPAEQGPVRHP